MKANILDVACHLAGYKADKQTGTCAGLFEEFKTYFSEEFGEVEERTVTVEKRSLSMLDMSSVPFTHSHNGSAGESQNSTTYAVEFTDGHIVVVKPEVVAKSNYSHTEPVFEDGESINACVSRHGKTVKRIVQLDWYFSLWNEHQRDRGVIIYS